MTFALPHKFPREELAEYIERALATTPDALAGIRVAEDGAVLEVHLTIPYASVMPRVYTAVHDFRYTVPPTTALPEVRVIAEATNSLRSLHAVQDGIDARARELEARGIRLLEWGVDTWKNRVRIGVQDLTPERQTVVEQEFGADKVFVFAGGGFGFARSLSELNLGQAAIRG